MSAILQMIVAAFPRALLAIAGKLFTEKFMVSVLKKLIMYGLEKLASNTKTKIDDQLVADIKKQLGEEG